MIPQWLATVDQSGGCRLAGRVDVMSGAEGATDVRRAALEGSP
jgi:hypothetical protein